MNALFGFLSSPLKKQPERPSSTMPATASQSRTYSPRERRLSKRASDRFSVSESEGRSPRSRRSNVSSTTTSVHDTTGDISITSSRRETIATMPPPSKTPKRVSMGAVQSSPILNRPTASQRVASSPRVQPSPRRQPSVELGEDSIVSGFNDTNHSPAILNRAASAKKSPAISSRASSAKNSPAISNRVPSAKNSPALSARSRRSSVMKSPATTTVRKETTKEANFTAAYGSVVESDIPVARPSPRTQPRSRRSQVVAVEEEQPEEEEVHAAEEYEVEDQEVEAQEADEEEIEQPESEQEVEADNDQEHEFKRIMDHRWVGDKIELRVEWSDGERTWSDEQTFHEDAPDALFEFWRKQPHGRPENPKDPGVYQVFAIRKHRTHRGKKQVLVEWLGYDSSEQTWENQSYIEQVAKGHVEQYMSKLKGTDKTKAKANTNTRTAPASKKGTAKPVAKGRGRPKAETKSSTRTSGKTQGKSRVTKR
ncbi:chromo domain-containing [Fusarium sporotrichioides]|uniref:Chromo domain-containing n=1 Tax=Fusarium sporotrichioides TaxID=5514 RepID=A0A395SC60_FUSSP|nr:chromo domain-containing [Fusarium sporotrichioides]